MAKEVDVVERLREMVETHMWLEKRRLGYHTSKDTSDVGGSVRCTASKESDGSKRYPTRKASQGLPPLHSVGCFF